MKKALMMVFIVIICTSSCIKQEMQNQLGVLNISFKGRSASYTTTTVYVDTIKGVNTLIKYTCTLSNNQTVSVFSDGYATYQSDGIKSSNIVVSPDTTIQIKDGPLWEVHLKKVKFLYPTRDTIIIDGYFKRQ